MKKETRPSNYPKLENYTPTRFMLPTSHYDKAKADRAVRFIENLRHTKGKWAGKRFWLLPWQEQIIRDIFGVVKEDGNRQFLTAYVEIGKKNGKQLALDTPIPTPGGFTSMGDLQVGDTIFDESGKPCHVVAKSEVDDTEQAYRLTFRDGSSIVAGERHLWDVEYIRRKPKTALMQTGRIYRLTKRKRRILFRIPAVKSLDAGDYELPDVDFHYLESIEPLEEKVKMQCIQVDSPSHCYLAGRSFVKTHNSELAAAVALYLLYADNEPSAEVYGAAADRQQASIVFDVANQMVQMTPALLKRSKIMAATKRIVNYSNAGFYQVLSAEVGCVSGDTVIQLADGSLKRADEVKGGDVILAYDGQTPVFDRVVSVREEEPAELYEVTTHHGRTMRVTANHPFWRMEPGRRMQDLTHRYGWMKAEKLCVNDRLGVALGWPSSTAPESGITTLEAWALGAWAGDGDCTHFRFINPDRPVIDKLRTFMESIGSGLKSVYSTRQRQEGKDKYQDPIEHVIMGVGKRRKSPGREWVRENFSQSSKARTKVIPDRVMTGGKEAWAAFLAGYIDTDGAVTENEVRICSVSEGLRRQCQILFARLGVNASVASKLCVTVSGKPQLRKLWSAVEPYMAHEGKRERLRKLSEMEIHLHQRSSESDKVKSVRSLGVMPNYSFEMERYQTHATDGIITHNTKHGLNVSGLVFDEVHAQPNRKLYDVLTKGSGDAREQPLFFLITTAGTDKQSICYELHTKAKDILDGRKVDPTFYPVVFGLTDDDDWHDEKNWYKANPSLGQTIQIERVREAYREAIDNPAEENVFKQLRLNMWVSSTTRFIPEQIYDLGNQPIDMESLKGRECYGGLDLSSTGDITAFVLVFPPRTEDEKYIVLPFFWVPEDTIPIRVRKGSVPYDVWKQQGYLLATEGNVIHYGFIEKTIEELGKLYNIKEIAFDRWGAVQMTQNLEGMGFTVVPFGQGYKDMSPPTKEFYKLLMQGQIIHGGNPILRWMAGNVVVETDPAENIKPTKAKSPEKIDGIVATIMALDRCIRHDQLGSVYDEPGRGLLVF